MGDTYFDVFKFQMGQAVEFAHMAIRSLLLLNGGAAISLLALLGYLYQGVEDGPAAVDRNFICSLASFGMGALFSVITALLSYITQYRYALCDKCAFAEEDQKQQEHMQAGRNYHASAIVSCVFSLGFFVSGMFFAARAFY